MVNLVSFGDASVQVHYALNTIHKNDAFIPNHHGGRVTRSDVRSDQNTTRDVAQSALYPPFSEPFQQPGGSVSRVRSPLSSRCFESVLRSRFGLIRLSSTVLGCPMIPFVPAFQRYDNCLSHVPRALSCLFRESPVTLPRRDEVVPRLN